MDNTLNNGPACISDDIPMYPVAGIHKGFKNLDDKINRDIDRLLQIARICIGEKNFKDIPKLTTPPFASEEDAAAIHLSDNIVHIGGMLDDLDNIISVIEADLGL